MAKDELFKGSGVRPFEFNDRVAEVFDDMLARSVPSYAQVMGMIGELLARFLRSGDRVYDLGCSTGNTLLELARRLEGIELAFIGIDNSPAMIKKATRKAELFSRSDRIRFIREDITRAGLDNPGAVILNYTLQFVAPARRRDFLDRVHAALRVGGVLILSEKLIAPGPELDRAFMDIHLDFKRDQGYSETEIARKREALENVLVPLTAEENLALLAEAGFREIETFSRWFNFVSMVAVKS
jgi:tRNA (cmo5U34)-methyltransferase